MADPVEAACRALAAYSRMESVEKPTDAEIASYVDAEWPLFREDVLTVLRAHLAAKQPSQQMKTAGIEADDMRTGGETCAHIWHAMRAQETKELEQVTQQ
jgi:hypothetical protein